MWCLKLNSRCDFVNKDSWDSIFSISIWCTASPAHSIFSRAMESIRCSSVIFWCIRCASSCSKTNSLETSPKPENTSRLMQIKSICLKQKAAETSISRTWNDFLKYTSICALVRKVIIRLVFLTLRFAFSISFSCSAVVNKSVMKINYVYPYSSECNVTHYFYLFGYYSKYRFV